MCLIFKRFGKSIFKEIITKVILRVLLLKRFKIYYLTVLITIGVL